MQDERPRRTTQQETASDQLNIQANSTRLCVKRSFPDTNLLIERLLPSFGQSKYCNLFLGSNLGHFVGIQTSSVVSLILTRLNDQQVAPESEEISQRYRCSGLPYRCGLVDTDYYIYFILYSTGNMHCPSALTCATPGGTQATATTLP
jgi:hypothetical protein